MDKIVFRKNVDDCDVNGCLVSVRIDEKLITVNSEESMDNILESASDDDVGCIYYYKGGGTKYTSNAYYLLLKKGG